MTIAADFLTTLNDLMVESATLLKPTRTLDPSGRQTKMIKTDITITCSIQPVSEKNWNVLEMGLPVTGTKVGYFKPSYSQFSTNYVVAVGDDIKDRDGVHYRIEEIVNKYTYAGTVAYIKAILVRQ